MFSKEPEIVSWTAITVTGLHHSSYNLTIVPPCSLQPQFILVVGRFLRLRRAQNSNTENKFESALPIRSHSSALRSITPPPPFWSQDPSFAWYWALSEPIGPKCAFEPSCVVGLRQQCVKLFIGLILEGKSINHTTTLSWIFILSKLVLYRIHTNNPLGIFHLWGVFRWLKNSAKFFSPLVLTRFTPLLHHKNKKDCWFFFSSICSK